MGSEHIREYAEITIPPVMIPPTPMPAIALPTISAALEGAAPQMIEPISNRLMDTRKVAFTYVGQKNYVVFTCSLK